jgi:hypothetical protein
VPKFFDEYSTNAISVPRPHWPSIDEVYRPLALRLDCIFSRL